MNQHNAKFTSTESTQRVCLFSLWRFAISNIVIDRSRIFWFSCWGSNIQRFVFSTKRSSWTWSAPRKEQNGGVRNDWEPYGIFAPCFDSRLLWLEVLLPSSISRLSNFQEKAELWRSKIATVEDIDGNQVKDCGLERKTIYLVSSSFEILFFCKKHFILSSLHLTQFCLEDLALVTIVALKAIEYIEVFRGDSTLRGIWLNLIDRYIPTKGRVSSL